MKIVHIDLPRLFTFTIKEYLVDVASAFSDSGHIFRQYDANPFFWHWIFELPSEHRSPGLLNALLNPVADETMVISLALSVGHLIEISQRYGVMVTQSGIVLPKGLQDSSAEMHALITQKFGRNLFHQFFEYLDNKVGISDNDVISLGSDYQMGVFWALNLAAWIRRYNKSSHIVLARHASENFSLVHHIEKLVKTRYCFLYLNSVILYEEDLPKTIVQICDSLKTGNFDSLENSAIKTENGEIKLFPPTTVASQRIAPSSYVIPSAYFDCVPVAKENLVYSMAMVRNKCFYKKCSFCAQITKHISDSAFAARAEIDRSLAACRELRRHGVTMLNFQDEAMHSNRINEFSRRLLKNGVEIHWVGRMIVSSGLDDKIIEIMKTAGCVEVLFGLETFDVSLARDMGKASGSAENEEDLIQIINRFSGNGLFVILSMISGFPTETSESRRRTIECLNKLRRYSGRISIISNRFELFHTSRIFSDPAKYNITAIESSLEKDDLKFRFDYTAGEHSENSDREALGDAAVSMVTALREGDVSRGFGSEIDEFLYHLDYCSVGLNYRIRNNSMLMSDLLKLA